MHAHTHVHTPHATHMRTSSDISPTASLSKTDVRAAQQSSDNWMRCGWVDKGQGGITIATATHLLVVQIRNDDCENVGGKVEVRQGNNQLAETLQPDRGKALREREVSHITHKLTSLTYPWEADMARYTFHTVCGPWPINSRPVASCKTYSHRGLGQFPSSKQCSHSRLPLLPRLGGGSPLGEGKPLVKSLLQSVEVVLVACHQSTLVAPQPPDLFGQLNTWHTANSTTHSRGAVRQGDGSTPTV